MSFWSLGRSDAQRPAPDMESILKRALPESLRFPQFYVTLNMRILGDLEATGHGHVDGTVEGSITLPDRTLTIGREGSVHGNVRAATVLVHGRLVGDVTATETIEITAGARVEGNLTAPRIVLREGARFSGRVNETPKPARRAAVRAISPWVPRVRDSKRPAVRPRRWSAVVVPFLPPR